jgi:hypothetical protein
MLYVVMFSDVNTAKAHVLYESEHVLANDGMTTHCCILIVHAIILHVPTTTKVIINREFGVSRP